MAEESPGLERIQRVYQTYAEARNALLAELNLGRSSNRDPLAEFSEWLVAAILRGRLADTPVQAHWDVDAPGIGKVQVKYLANTGADRWVNEHLVRVNEEMAGYAIVFYESLLPVSGDPPAGTAAGRGVCRPQGTAPAPGDDAPANARELHPTHQRAGYLPATRRARLARARLDRGDLMASTTRSSVTSRTTPASSACRSTRSIASCGLPPSAYRWRARWANGPTYVHAHAWLVTGHRIEAVDLERQTVHFAPQP